MLLLGCVRRLGLILLLVALGVGLWYFRVPLTEAVRGAQTDPPAPPGPSLELAAEAEAKLQELARGDRGTVSLSETEVQSLLEFRYGSFFPAFVDSPRVTLADDRLRLRARVPTAELVRIPALGEVGALLPDTADIELHATLLPLQGERVALAVDQLSAARVPLPRRIVPALLERLGRTDQPGLPADALAVPLPPGARSAYVRRDSLVFVGGSDGDPIP